LCVFMRYSDLVFFLKISMCLMLCCKDNVLWVWMASQTHTDTSRTGCAFAGEYDCGNCLGGRDDTGRAGELLYIPGGWVDD